MSCKISHYTIGWNINEELTLIPVLAHYKDSEKTPTKIETAYEAAESRKCILYLVDPEDFVHDLRFDTFKMDSGGNGYLSIINSAWIVDFLIIAQSLVCISSVLFYLRNKNKNT